MTGNILIFYKIEVNDNWFLPMEIYKYNDIVYLERENCDDCIGDTKYNKYYVVEVDDENYNIPEESCVEVDDDFVADERVKNIHKYVEEELEQSGQVIKDFRQLAFDIHGVDIFHKQTTGSLYKEYKKNMNGYGSEI